MTLPQKTKTDADDPMRIVHQYEPLALKVARSYSDCAADSEDLFQELCIAFWSVRESIPSDVNELTFMYRVAINRAISWKRKESTYARHMASFFRGSDPTSQDQDPSTSDDRLELLYIAIRKLPESDRSLILMQLDGRSYSEMSDVTGLSETVVGKRLSRARKKLAELITGEEQI